MANSYLPDVLTMFHRSGGRRPDRPDLICRHDRLMVLAWRLPCSMVLADFSDAGVDRLARDLRPVVVSG